MIREYDVELNGNKTKVVSECACSAVEVALQTIQLTGTIRAEITSETGAKFIFNIEKDSND